MIPRRWLLRTVVLVIVAAYVGGALGAAGVAYAQEAAPVLVGRCAPCDGVPLALCGTIGGAMASVIGILFWQLLAALNGWRADAKAWGDSKATLQDMASKLAALTVVQANRGRS